MWGSQLEGNPKPTTGQWTIKILKAKQRLSNSPSLLVSHSTCSSSLSGVLSLTIFMSSLSLCLPLEDSFYKGHIHKLRLPGGLNGVRPLLSTLHFHLTQPCFWGGGFVSHLSANSSAATWRKFILLKNSNIINVKSSSDVFKSAKKPNTLTFYFILSFYVKIHSVKKFQMDKVQWKIS